MRNDIHKTNTRPKSESSGIDEKIDVLKSQIRLLEEKLVSQIKSLHSTFPKFPDLFTIDYSLLEESTLNKTITQYLQEYQKYLKTSLNSQDKISYDKR